ncbi:type III secretion system translocon subunit SctE [Endozoicomonas sp. SM1973]|uniref:Type III secretion system translocon subunit SctE n=1 Tax=Spartinivicinus marinus TaxID=2994442 RepID=A0A853I9S9_9GAMM|nr:type III secretion system translocon subunit SctE [Spartinivicinus marinus]MCX4024666.1 type III secretion system translocon subunit SctE [Spartinivicinus marinus]NYZ66307.1 type III secretion system translocon subunit SctE [Spartinivicinus marinus]
MTDSIMFPSAISGFDTATDLADVKNIISSATSTSVPTEAAKSDANPQVRADSAAPSLTAPRGNALADKALAFAMLQTMMSQENFAIAKETINTTRQEKKLAAEERMEKLKESMDQQKEAKKGGFFGKLFGWIATAVTAIVGAVLIATGVGAAAGVALIACAVITGLNQISEETGGWLQAGVAKMFQAFGMSEEKAKEAAGWTLMAVSVAAGIAAAVVSGGASVAASFGRLAAKIATDVVAKLVKAIPQITRVVEASLQVATGATQIYSGVKQKFANDSKAEAMDLKAFLLKLQQIMDDESDRIKDILDRILNLASVVNEILSGQQTSNAKLNQRISA